VGRGRVQIRAPPRFVELENEQACGIDFGKWVDRPDGYWACAYLWRQMPMFNDGASPVWAALTIPRLADTLFDYLWLGAIGPNDHGSRIAQLNAERSAAANPN